jgi:hypothetical protein
MLLNSKEFCPLQSSGFFTDVTVACAHLARQQVKGTNFSRSITLHDTYCGENRDESLPNGQGLNDCCISSRIYLQNFRGRRIGGLWPSIVLSICAKLAQRHAESPYSPRNNTPGRFRPTETGCSNSKTPGEVNGPGKRERSGRVSRCLKR